MGESEGRPDRQDWQPTEAEAILPPGTSPTSSDELVPAPPKKKPEVRGEERSFISRLVGCEPEEILPKISQGDPLGLQVVCMRRVRERALIFDPQRAFDKSLIEAAIELSLCTDELELSNDWMQGSVDRALSRLLNDDMLAEQAEPGKEPRDVSPYRFVHDAFTTPLEVCRRATVEFHALPLRARLAFFYLLIDNMQVEDVLELGHWPDPEDLRLDIWEVMRTLAHVSREEVEAFRNRERRE